MRKLFFVVILFLHIVAAKAQSNNSSWGISFTPSMVSTSTLTYGLQLGAEYSFSNRWNVLTELAIPLKDQPHPRVYDERFFRIKPELRYFLSKHSDNSGAYTGLQLSYSIRSWKDQDGSYFEEQLYEDSAVTFQSASVKSPVFTSSAQIGSVIKISRHFCLDLFTGVGVRVINTTYSEVVYTGKIQAARPVCTVMFSPDPAWWVNGTVVRPNFNLGFRLIYRL